VTSTAAARLDRDAVGAGALVTLAIAVPVIVVVAVLSHNSGRDSNVWFADPIALFVAFVTGGHRAARKRPETPLMHAAAAGGLAMIALAIVSVVGHLVEGKPVPIVSLVLYAQIAIGLAVFGGYVAMRRAGSS
jgi:peptidoglycan/LPS O-acetylase OafA/YrhL